MLSRRTSYSESTTTSPSASRRSSAQTPPTSTEDWDADDEDAMSSHDFVPSRPLSVAIPTGASAAQGSVRRPGLREILSNTSPAPWSLAAFMAYLANNHCLETLEFTMDAGRYRKHYQKMMARAGSNGLPPSKDREYVRALWMKLVDAYIRPNGSREVNLPSTVRDPILNMRPIDMPPQPEMLDQAVVKIYELMEDSVLVPFLNSVCAAVSPTIPQSFPYATADDSRSSSKSPALQIREARPRRIAHAGGSAPHSSTYAHHRQSAPSALPMSLGRTRYSTKLTATSTSSPSGDVDEAEEAAPSASELALGYSSSGPGLVTDDGASTDGRNQDLLTPPPTSPPMSDLSLRRDSGMWKKLGRLGKKGKDQGRVRDEQR